MKPDVSTSQLTAKKIIRTLSKLLWWTLTFQLAKQLRQRARISREARIVQASGLFDTQWYLQEYPDVAAAQVDPVTHYVVTGGFEGRNPSPQFESGWYLSEYRDIAAAHQNPLVHYVTFGKAEGRRMARQCTSSQTIRGKSFRSLSSRPRIAFISGEAHTPGHRYRVLNAAEALSRRFFNLSVTPAEVLAPRIRELATFDLLWIWRAQWSDTLADLVDGIRRNGGRIVYDIDDLIFCPELARTELIDGIRAQGLGEDCVAASFARIKTALMEADHCVVPTLTLKREVNSLGKLATVVPNGFDLGRMALSRDMRLARKESPNNDLIRIGYLTGTKTHQKDLALAAPALGAILGQFPETRLVLTRDKVMLEEFPDLMRRAKQVEWREFVGEDQTPLEYARLDINLAPLEVGNRFCEAKSELKYFEAALVGVPTVASPTAPFFAAIRNGETGFLANSDEEWHTCVHDLVGDFSLRVSVAQRARREVRWPYGPERRSLLMAELVSQLLARTAPDLVGNGIEA